MSQSEDWKLSEDLQGQLRENEDERKAIQEEAKQKVSPIIPHLYPARVLEQTHFVKSEDVVCGLFKMGETVLLLGKPKIGKSRFLAQLTIALSLGAPAQFLGMPVQRSFRVLYIDLENKPETVQGRFRRMLGEQVWPRDTLFFYAPPKLSDNEASLMHSQGVKALRNMLELTRPEVLIVDTWRLLVGGDENKAQEVLQALKTLSSLRAPFPQMAIILVHHVKKSGQFPVKLRMDPSLWVESCSGSFALVGHSESTFGIEREQDEDHSERIVFNGVSRNFSPPLLLLEDCDDLTFRRLEGEEYAEAIMSAREQKVWLVARDLGWFKFTDLEQRCKEQPKILWSMLKKAQSLHLVDRSEQYFRVT